MHTSTKTITRALLCLALLCCKVSFTHAAAAESEAAKLLKKEADTLAGKIADKIKDDPNIIKDEAAIEKAITELAAAGGFIGGAAAQRVRDQVWALVAPAWVKAQGLDPQSTSGQLVLTKLTASVAAPAAASGSTGSGEATGSGKADDPKAKDKSLPPDPLAYLQAGSLNINNRAKLVTAEVFANYSLLSGRKHTALGYRLTTSLPSPGASAADYATSQLLTRDGGLMNFYFSLASPRNKYPSPDKGHPYDTDKRYFRNNDDSDALSYYLLNGVGIRGYSPNTNVGSGASGSTPSTLQALGTAYLGAGFDGPSFNGNGRDGSIGLETYGSVNTLNKKYLTSIYNTKLARSTYGCWTAAVRVSVSNYVISAFYSLPFNYSMRSFAKDVAGVSIAYNGKTTAPKSPSASKTAAGDTK